MTNKIRTHKLICIRIFYLKVPRTGFEPARRNRHYPLKVACLPISPPGQELKMCFLKSDANIGCFFEKKEFGVKKNIFYKVKAIKVHQYI